VRIGERSRKQHLFARLGSIAESSASCSGLMAFFASRTSASDAAEPAPLPGEKKSPEPSTELLWRCLGRGGDELSAGRSRSAPAPGPAEEIFSMSMKVEKRSSSEPISSRPSPPGPPPPPPRSRSSGRRKATSDLARRWCAPRRAADGAGGGKAGAARPGGSVGSGCCIAAAARFRPAAPRGLSLYLSACVSPVVPARARESESVVGAGGCVCKQEWWLDNEARSAAAVFRVSYSRVAFGFGFF
jgi:hypothetical protein